MGIFMYGNQMMHHAGEFSLYVLLYMLLVRLLVVVASFIFAGLNNSNRPAQSTFKWLTTISAEYVATLFAFSFCIPLAWLLAPRLGRASIKGQPVVLLVHGLFSNSGGGGCSRIDYGDCGDRIDVSIASNSRRSSVIWMPM